jgi:hypothetical protein
MKSSAAQSVGEDYCWLHFGDFISANATLSCGRMHCCISQHTGQQEMDSLLQREKEFHICVANSMLARDLLSHALG